MIVPVRVDGCSPIGLLGLRTLIDLVGLDDVGAGKTLVAGINAAVHGSFRPAVPPEFPGTSSAKPTFPGSPTDERLGSPAVTVLHLTGLRFGSDEAGEGRLLDELVAFGVTGELRPDLVVVTGDLTETGAKREFDQAHDFLIGLTEAIGLTPDRVAIVPGSCDVNRRLCEAYVVQCEEDDDPPQPPYWPKWKYFDALLRRFYGADVDVGFEPNEEWSVFEVADRNVVVAGLNSTTAETHEVRYGELGQRQLAAVDGRLHRYEKDGWLRVGAVHHDPRAEAGSLRDAADLDRMLGPRLNLLLHGGSGIGAPARLPSGTPVLTATVGHYQILRIGHGGWESHASDGK